MVKIEYKLEMLFGIIGGALLILVGAIGSASTYLMIIEYAKTYANLSEDIATLLAQFFVTLATLGGITVIIGSILIGIGGKRLGSWLVGIGAGISLTSLLLKIYVLGPIIGELIKNNQFPAVFDLLGVEFGLLGAGVLLSFLATLTNYRWMLYSFVLSIVNIYIGVTADPVLIDMLISHLNLPASLYPYIYSLEMLVAYVGLLFLIIMLLVGAGYFGLSKTLSILAVIALIPSEMFMALRIVSLYNNITLLELSRFLIQTLSIIAILFFVVKAKPVHRKEKKAKKIEEEKKKEEKEEKEEVEEVEGETEKEEEKEKDEGSE